MLYLLTPYREVIMYILLVILVCSCFWLSVYTIKRKIINKKSSNRSFFPGLSIIIAAYNEEKDIGATLKSIFLSNYPKKKIDIIVIDDGSKDKTFDIAKKFPINLFRYKKNGGKVRALNKGISLAKHDIIFTLDADTYLMPNSLKLIAKHFKDENVGAVCGVYKARFQNKLLEKLQGLEYLSFSLTRKLQETLGAILVVPGAIAGFRKKALKRAGGFDDDTVLEDSDMTLKIHKLGYKIKCEKNAFAYVIAPSTLSAFVRQRTRWMRGGFQVFNKHSDLFVGKLGIIGILWFVDIIGVVLQFVVFGLVLNHFINIGFSLAILKLWLLNFLTLNFHLFDIVILLTVVLTSLGLISAAISIKITNDSMRKLSLYPLMMFYCTFQFFILMKSLFEEIIEFERTW